MLFLPIKDENPTRRRPVVTLVIIGLNVLVFIHQLTLSQDGEVYLNYQFGLVPAWLTGLGNLPPPPAVWALPRFTTLITSAFLHGGFFHLGGNMLFLWIFGNNIEDLLGRFRFVIFYLLGAVLSGLAQVISGPSSPIPMVGASGAIAMVLGAYLVMFPHAKVVVLVWLIFFLTFVKVPAILILGLWFLMQVLGAGGPGVAWMAHVGGFVSGLILIRFFVPRPKLPRQEPPPTITLH